MKVGPALRFRRWRLWCAVLSVAIGLRLLVLAVSFETIPPGDTLNYYKMVQHMLAGDGMVFIDPVMGPVRAQFPPLYPLLLWALSEVGGLSPATIAILNFACDLGTALAMVWLARLIDLRGHLAAAVYLLWPANILLAPLAHKEGLTAMLAVLTAGALLAAIERSRMAYVFGALSGLLALTQPALAPLPAVLALFMFKEFPSGTWPKAMLAAVTIAAAVMLPWWIRNWFVFGQFVPLTSMAGMGLWIGAIPWGIGTWAAPSQHLLVGNELAISKAAAAEAWQYISADPLDYLSRCTRKIGRAFRADVAPGHFLTLRAPAWAFVTRLTMPLTGLLIGLASVSIALRRPPLIGRIILACLLQILLFQFWFEFAERHRYFLTPFLLMAATQLWRPRVLGPPLRQPPSLIV